MPCDLKEHAKSAHPGRFFELPVLPYGMVEDSTLCLWSCLGELFMLYMGVRDEIMYCLVQAIRTSNEVSKYICEFTLRTANGIEKTSATLLVTDYSEDFNTRFSCMECLSLDEAVARHYVVGNKLKVTVKLSRV
jgi:hypothetical protein